jgi:micrococcal nuclease
MRHRRQRRATPCATAALLVLLPLLGGPAVWAEDSVSAVVLRVLDGDTLEVRLEDGSVARIRLDGIDCPEKTQSHGLDARMATAQLVEGGRIRLNGHQRDKYGRLIAQVETPDGRSVNERLVEDGHCWWYRKYAPGHRRLERFEAEARAAGRGLWAEPNPIPPWEWRKRGRAEHGAEGG